MNPELSSTHFVLEGHKTDVQSAFGELAARQGAEMDRGRVPESRGEAGEVMRLSIVLRSARSRADVVEVVGGTDTLEKKGMKVRARIDFPKQHTA